MHGRPVIVLSTIGARSGKLRKTPLMRAFHRQSMGCHMDKKQSPGTCGDCHEPAPRK